MSAPRATLCYVPIPLRRRIPTNVAIPTPSAVSDDGSGTEITFKVMVPTSDKKPEDCGFPSTGL